MPTRPIGIGAAVGISAKAKKRKPKPPPKPAATKRTVEGSSWADRSLPVRIAHRRAMLSLPERVVFGWNELDRKTDIGSEYAKTIAAFREATKTALDPDGQDLPTSVIADLGGYGVLADMTVAERTAFFRQALRGIAKQDDRLMALQEGRTWAPEAIDPIALLVWKPRTAREFVAGPGQVSLQPLVAKPGMEEPVMAPRGYETPQHKDYVRKALNGVLYFSTKRVPQQRQWPTPEDVQPVVVHDYRDETQYAAVGTYQLLLPQLYGYKNVAQRLALKGSIRGRYGEAVADLMAYLKKRMEAVAKLSEGDAKREALQLAEAIKPNGVWAGKSGEAATRAYAQMMVMRGLVLGTIYRERPDIPKQAQQVGREARQMLKSLGVPLTREQVDKGLASFWAELDNDRSGLARLLLAYWVASRPPGESSRLAIVNYANHFPSDWWTPDVKLVREAFYAEKAAESRREWLSALAAVPRWLWEGEKKIKGPIYSAVAAGRQAAKLAERVADSKAGKAARAVFSEADELIGERLTEQVNFYADIFSDDPDVVEDSRALRPSAIAKTVGSAVVEAGRAAVKAYNSAVDFIDGGWAKLALAEAYFEGLQEQARGTIPRGVRSKDVGEVWWRKENPVSRLWAWTPFSYGLSTLEALVSDEFDLWKEAWREAVKKNLEAGYQRASSDMAMRVVGLDPVKHPTLKIAVEIAPYVLADVLIGRGAITAARAPAIARGIEKIARAAPWLDDAASAAVRLGSVRHIKRVFRIDDWNDALTIARLAKDYKTLKGAEEAGETAEKLRADLSAAVEQRRWHIKRAKSMERLDDPVAKEAAVLHRKAADDLLKAVVRPTRKRLEELEGATVRTAKPVVVVEKGGQVSVAMRRLEEIQEEISILEREGSKLVYKARGTRDARRTYGRWSHKDMERLRVINERLEDLREQRGAQLGARLFDAVTTTRSADDVLLEVRDVMARNLVDMGKFYTTFPLRSRLRLLLGPDHPMRTLLFTHIPRSRPTDPVFGGMKYLESIGRILLRTEDEIDKAVDGLAVAIASGGDRVEVAQRAAQFIVKTEDRWRNDFKRGPDGKGLSPRYKEFVEWRRKIRQGAEPFMLGRAYLPRVVWARDPETGKMLGPMLQERSLVPSQDIRTVEHRRYIDSVTRKTELERGLAEIGRQIADADETLKVADSVVPVVEAEIRRVNEVLAQSPVGPPLWERSKTVADALAKMWSKSDYRRAVRQAVLPKAESIRDVPRRYIERFVKKHPQISDPDEDIVRWYNKHFAGRPDPDAPVATQHIHGRDVELRALTTKGGKPAISVEDLLVLEAKIEYRIANARALGLSETALRAELLNRELVRSAIADQRLAGVMLAADKAERRLSAIYEDLVSGRFAPLRGDRTSFRLPPNATEPHQVVSAMLHYLLTTLDDLSAQIGAGRATVANVQMYARELLLERAILEVAERAGMSPLQVRAMVDDAAHELAERARSKGLVKYRDVDGDEVEDRVLVSDPLDPEHRFVTTWEHARAIYGLRFLARHRWGKPGATPWEGRVVIDELLTSGLDELLEAMPVEAPVEAVGKLPPVVRPTLAKEKASVVARLVGRRSPLPSNVRQQLHDRLQNAVKKAEEAKRAAGGEPVNVLPDAPGFAAFAKVDASYLTTDEFLEVVTKAIEDFRGSSWETVADFSYIVPGVEKIENALRSALGGVPKSVRDPLRRLIARAKRPVTATAVGSEVREAWSEFEAAIDHLVREHTYVVIGRYPARPQAARRLKSGRVIAAREGQRVVEEAVRMLGGRFPWGPGDKVTAASLEQWVGAQRTEIAALSEKVRGLLEEAPAGAKATDEAAKAHKAIQLLERLDAKLAGLTIDDIAGKRVVDERLDAMRAALRGLQRHFTRSGGRPVPRMRKISAAQAGSQEVQDLKKVIAEAPPESALAKKARARLEHLQPRAALDNAVADLKELAKREKQEARRIAGERQRLVRQHKKRQNVRRRQEAALDELKRARDDVEGYILYLTGRTKYGGRGIEADMADMLVPTQAVTTARKFLHSLKDEGVSTPRGSYEVLTKARKIATERKAALAAEFADLTEAQQAARKVRDSLIAKQTEYGEELEKLRTLIQSDRAAMAASQDMEPVPFWVHQMQSWVYPGEDYELLAIFNMGKVARKLEELQRARFLGLASIDDFTQAYKNTILAKLSTMIRIVLGDEAVRLVTTENVNPLKIPYYRRIWKELSGGKTTVEARRLEKRLSALTKQAKKAAKAGATDQLDGLIEEVSDISAKLDRMAQSSIPRGSSLHEMSELIDRAQSSSHMVWHILDPDGSLNPEWLSIYPGFVRMLREEPLIKRYIELRYPAVGKGPRVMRKQSPVYDRQELHSLLLEELDSSPRLAEFVARTARSERVTKDDYITHFLSLMDEWETPGNVLGRHVLRGEAVDVSHFKTLLGDPSAAEKMPVMVGRVRWRPGSRHAIARFAKGETRLHRALYGTLDTLSNEVKQILYAARFEDSYETLKVLNPFMPEEMLVQRASLRAARLVDEAMYVAEPYMLEHLLRNISLFLPAYRQFWVYWGRAALKNPWGVGVGVIHLNQMPDSFVIDRETPLLGHLVGATEAFIEALGGPDAAMQDLRLNINPRSVVFLTGGSSGRDESLIVQQLPGFGPIFTVPISMMQRLRPDLFHDIDRLPGLSFARRNQVANSAFDNIIYGTVTGIGNLLGVGNAGDAWSNVGYWLMLAKHPEDRKKVLINIAREQYARYLERVSKDPEAALYLDPPTIEQVRSESASLAMLNGLSTFLSSLSVRAEDAGLARRADTERAMILIENSLAELGYDRLGGMDGVPEHAREKVKELLKLRKETLEADPTYALIQRYFDADVDEQERILEKHPEITPWTVATRAVDYASDEPLVRGEFYRQWLRPRDLKDPEEVIDAIEMRLRKDEDRALARSLTEIIRERDEWFEKQARLNGIKEGSSRYIQWRREFEQGVGDFAGAGLLDVHVPIEKLPEKWRGPFVGSATVPLSSLFSSPQEILDIAKKDELDLARQRPGLGETTVQMAAHIYRLPLGQQFLEQTNAFPDFVRKRYEQRAQRIKGLIEMSRMRKYWFTKQDWADLGYEVSDKVIEAQDKLNLIYEEYERRKGDRAWNSKEALEARRWMVAEQDAVIDSDPEVKRILGMGVAERLLKSDIGLTEPLINGPDTWVVLRPKKGEESKIHKVTKIEWRQFLRARKEWEAGFSGTIKQFRDKWDPTLSPAMRANLDELIRAWSWKTYLRAAMQARDALRSAYNPYTRSYGFSPYSKYGQAVKAWLDNVSKQLLGAQPFGGTMFVAKGQNPGFADEWRAYNELGELNTRLIDWTY